MLKRITRYSLLILTLLLAGSWVAGFFHTYTYREQGLTIRSISVGAGSIYYLHSDPASSPDFGPRYQIRSMSLLRPVHRIGLGLPHFERHHFQGTGPWVLTSVGIPIWTLLVPSLAAYLILWKRSRKELSKGFELETKPIEPRPVKEVRA